MKFLQTEPGAEPVIVEGAFAAPAERVFRAWTEPDEIIKWFGKAPHSLVRAEIDLTVGGRWRFVLEDSESMHSSLEGEYVSIVENSLLVFTWAHVTTAGDGTHEVTPESKVTVRFVPDGKATRLHLTHETIRREEGRLGVGRGWNASFASLEALLASPD